MLFRSHEELKRQVPDEMEHAFVDASHTTCNPNQHFVPSTAKVSRGTRQECLRLFRAKMRSRAFLALDEGGPSHVVCNGITFENADRLGITPDETPFAEEDFPSTEDRTNRRAERSEEHTSELQSPDHLVCRLLLEKKKKKKKNTTHQLHVPYTCY